MCLYQEHWEMNLRSHLENTACYKNTNVCHHCACYHFILYVTHVTDYHWPMMGFSFLYGFPELLLLTLFLAGGYLSSSLAIATDAAHLLTDFASFMISLFALWVGSRPATRVMSFGWHRAEVLGALTSVLLIWVVTGILVYLAVQRVTTRDFEIESTSMLITSGVGLVVNLVWVLEYSLSHKFYNETYWWWKEVLEVWSLKRT